MGTSLAILSPISPSNKPPSSAVCWMGPGRHRVHAHAEAGQFLRQRFRARHDGRLGTGVDHLTGVADAPGVAAQVHDVAALLLHHVGDDDVRGHQEALVVDGDHPVPQRLFGLYEELLLVDAGVVHQDVDPAHGARDGGHGLLGLRVVGDVALHGHGLGAGGFQFFHGLLCRLDGHIQDGDGGAVRGQPQGDGLADTGRTAGDDGRLTFKSHDSYSSPCVYGKRAGGGTPAGPAVLETTWPPGPACPLSPA